jgi:hypothetical protein
MFWFLYYRSSIVFALPLYYLFLLDRLSFSQEEELRRIWNFIKILILLKNCLRFKCLRMRIECSAIVWVYLCIFRDFFFWSLNKNALNSYRISVAWRRCLEKGCKIGSHSNVCLHIILGNSRSCHNYQMRGCTCEQPPSQNQMLRSTGRKMRQSPSI